MEPFNTKSSEQKCQARTLELLFITYAQCTFIDQALYVNKSLNSLSFKKPEFFFFFMIS